MRLDEMTFFRGVVLFGWHFLHNADSVADRSAIEHVVATVPTVVALNLRHHDYVTT